MGNDTCLVRSCAKLSKIGKSYHKFPLAEGARKLWVKFVTACNGVEVVPTSSSRLCSQHFRTCCFATGKRSRFILPNHIPSVGISNCGTPIVEPASHILESSAENMDVDESPPVTNLGDGRQDLVDLIDKLKDKLSKADALVEEQKDQLKRCQRKIRRLEERYCGSKRSRGVQVTMEQQKSKGFRRGRPYTQDEKEFATEVSYYSTAAYNVIRKKYKKRISRLPHISSVRRWNQWIGTNPGFLRDSLAHLTKVSTGNPEMKYVLVIDEIAIRQQLVHRKGVIEGLLDYGELQIPAKRMVASHAMFVYASSINGSTRLPIAYFLTCGCNAVLIEEVLSTSLIKMEEARANVIGVVFDGLPANFTAAKRLGANFDIYSSKFQPWFPHPTSSSKVNVLPDICHMLKLLRNSFNHFQEFLDPDDKVVSWKYVEQLQKTQTQEGLHGGNKVTARHVDFTQQKMKVKLAAQLLSSSVAAGIEACRKMGIEDFVDSEGTVKFLTLVDRLFDACNARVGGEGKKAPLSAENKSYWQSLFSEAKKYLKEVRVEDWVKKSGGVQKIIKPLALSKRGTCVKGWVVLLTSIEQIMEEFVLPPNSGMTYLSTYKLCQDVIELFFSTIRRRLGCNNNPNVVQLQGALRGVLSVKLDPSLNGNCVPLEDVTTTTIEPRGGQAEVDQILLEEDEEIPDLPSYQTLSLFVNNVVVYIAGFVGRKLLKLIDCGYCQASLTVVESSIFLMRSDFILLSEKSEGRQHDSGLFIPSPDLIKVCKAAEKVIRLQETEGVQNMSMKGLVAKTLYLLTQESLFMDLRMLDMGEHTWDSGHVQKLHTLIITHYCKVRLHHLAKEATLKFHPKSIRNNLTKSVIFSGQ